MEEHDEILELELDDGEIIEAVLIDSIELGGFTYVVLEEVGNPEDAFILKEISVQDDESIFEELSSEEFELIAGLLTEEFDDYELE